MSSYVRFYIGKQGYAIGIEHILEVLHLVEVVPVPNQSPDQLGVITLREQIIPVIDLRYSFEEQHSELTISTPLIAVRVGDKAVALVVDFIDDVVELPGPFDPYPEPTIDKVTHVDGKVIMILNLDQFTRV